MLTSFAVGQAKACPFFSLIRRFNAVNKGMGYPEIMIYSPREVTNYEY